jgi:hypothetical protein
MTDLYLDNKQVEIKCSKNMWRVNSTIFIPKDVTTSNEYYSGRTYDHIYLPLTLQRCLVLYDAAVAFIDSPYFPSLHHGYMLQEIEFTGKDMEMITMEDYHTMQKQGII